MVFRGNGGSQFLHGRSIRGINKILQDPRGGSGKFYCVTQPKSSNLSPQPSSDTDVEHAEQRSLGWRDQLSQPDRKVGIEKIEYFFYPIHPFSFSFLQELDYASYGFPIN